MKTYSAIVLGVAALATANLAQATVVNAKFNGIVQSQTGTILALNSVISGEFVYDTVLSAYTLFSIAGKSVAPGYTSTADLSPDSFTALYTAQVSPVPGGGNLNSTFSLDLEALTTGWTGGAIGLLTSAQLPANLDTAASSFTYYIASSVGTNVQTVTARLTGMQITSAVPEPTSVALLLAGVAVVGAVVRRRQAA